MFTAVIIYLLRCFHNNLVYKCIQSQYIVLFLLFWFANFNIVLYIYIYVCVCVCVCFQEQNNWYWIYLNTSFLVSYNNDTNLHLTSELLEISWFIQYTYINKSKHKVLVMLSFFKTDSLLDFFCNISEWRPTPDLNQRVKFH